MPAMCWLAFDGLQYSINTIYSNFGICFNIFIMPTDYFLISQHNYDIQSWKTMKDEFHGLAVLEIIFVFTLMRHSAKIGTQDENCLGSIAFYYDLLGVHTEADCVLVLLCMHARVGACGHVLQIQFPDDNAKSIWPMNFKLGT